MASGYSDGGGVAGGEQLDQSASGIFSNWGMYGHGQLDRHLVARRPGLARRDVSLSNLAAHLRCRLDRPRPVGALGASTVARAAPGRRFYAPWGRYARDRLLHLRDFSVGD